MSTFAARLKYHMLHSHVTVESLALETGYSETYIGRLRNGHQTNPTLSFVERAASVLGISPATLAGWE